MAAAMASCSTFIQLATPSPAATLTSSFKGLSLKIQARPVFAGSLYVSSAKPSTPPVVAAQKGYKMKTHHAAAKRFRATGSGKIICRRAGKQHLLWKKNTKRRKRLSKTALVEKADYENITHALPYLKVSKK